MGPAVNQTRSKRIAGADPIHSVSDVVSATRHKLDAIIQAGGEAVLRSAL
jgi:hypothetical protein